MTLQELAAAFGLKPEQTTVAKPTLANIRKMLRTGYVLIGEAQGLAVFANDFQIKLGLEAHRALINRFL